MTTTAVSSTKSFLLRTHPHLYEINTWAWLEKLSLRLGRRITIAEAPDSEWDALARTGFDIIWLMGIWQRSAASRRIALADTALVSEYGAALPGWKPEDVVGSPYSVAQYVPDPRVGTWDSIDAIREKLHARGMALFLDFVGNHTALDHPWTREHPEFYVQGAPNDSERDPSSFFRVDTAEGSFSLALARDPYFPPWKDTAQLNHFSSAMRAAQLADLRTIASHCDGVRCDMAMLQLNDIFAKTWGHLLAGAKRPETEFWTEAHATSPGLILLAEVYWGLEQRLLDLGFSFAYDKNLYDAVRDIRVMDLRTQLSSGISYQDRLARFLENHDESRCATVFGKERLASAGTLMGTLPGMRFYHQGELEGAKIHFPISLRMPAGEPTDPAVLAFFTRILRLTNDDAFHNGEWNLLRVTPERDTTSENLVVYEWQSAKSWKVIAVNLTGDTSQGRISFGSRPLAAKEYVFYDALNDVRYVRSSAELRSPGLLVRRDGFQAHVFDVTPA